MDEIRRRATSFGSVAREYESARPDYPAAAVAWLAAELGIGPEQDVLDLGAGTGKLTRQISGLGANVVAVEPDDEMRVELERALPGIDALPGTAEAMPLPDRASTSSRARRRSTGSMPIRHCRRCGACCAPAEVSG